MTESHRIEYKSALSDSLEKEVIDFLNAQEGGVIYWGVNDTGNPVGLEKTDDVQLRIKDRLKHNIVPSCLGLFELIAEKHEDLDVLKLIVAGGLEKPYYIRKQGMSERGCFIRVGSAAEPMPTRMIEQLFARRIRNSIGNMRSPRGELRFEQLKIYYQETGHALNEHFLSTLELQTPDGDPNYATYLLADDNGISIKVAKYAGETRVDLIENSEYGQCSLIKALKRVLEKLEGHSGGLILKIFSTFNLSL